MAIKDEIVALLSSPDVVKIDFTLGAITINGDGFKRVRTAIENGKIAVVVSPKMKKNQAKYTYTHNRLVVGFSTMKKDGDREALLVHECAHAVCDVAGKKLLMVESEAAAYIAQCSYFYFKNEADFSSGSVTPTFAADVLREAWAAAATARSKKALAAGDVAKLIATIGANPLYKQRRTQEDAFDGV